MSGPAALASAPARSLDEIAAELRDEHEHFEAAMRNALEHALRCGELLNEARRRVQHGAWTRWLGANFAGSDRTARGYMQLARELDRNELDRRRVADLGVRQALQLVAKPTPPDLSPLKDPAVRAELGLDAEPLAEPPGAGEYVSLRTVRARKSLALIDVAIRKGELKVATIREVRGLVPEATADLLRDAAGEWEDAAAEARALADHILEGRG